MGLRTGREMDRRLALGCNVFKPSGVTWVQAGFNFWYKFPPSSCIVKHHVTIDKILPEADGCIGQWLKHLTLELPVFSFQKVLFHNELIRFTTA